MDRKFLIVDWRWIKRYREFQMNRRGDVGDYIVHIMTFIRDHPGCRFRELKNLNLPIATLSRLLKELFEDKLIVKTVRKGSNLATYHLPEGVPDNLEFRSYEEEFKLAIESMEKLRKAWVEDESTIIDALTFIEKKGHLPEFEKLYPQLKIPPWLKPTTDSPPYDGRRFLTVHNGKKLITVMVKNNEELREFEQEYETKKSKGYYQKR